ncbi:hypothetical protein [Acinetobacter sp. YH16037]|uniref:hypothetical protein n=1 Tax=Acinetobacter sp. YH16037 TaxID=2601182 RepID=UPI0015D29AD1
MDKFYKFLNLLHIQLQMYEKFDNWKHLEILTAHCSNYIIKQDNEFSGWFVDYDEDAHRFPDVIINTPYGNWGIEVKSSKSKNWETLGGSINESTKVSGLNEIFILFGKNIDNQINIKIKEFSKCVKSVAVTHSPRYLIDMEIDNGKDIFSLLNTTYQSVCNHNQPFDIFKEYFKEKARRSNTKFWFLSDDENERSSETYQELEWKFFNGLTSREKIELISEAIILYPFDLFGSTKTIYDNSNLFFLGRNIISNSMRDNFTAGGQFYVCGYKVPQKYSLLLNEDYLDIIHKLLSNVPTIEMKQVYETENIQQIKSIWFQQITRALERTVDEACVREFILSGIKEKV